MYPQETPEWCGSQGIEVDADTLLTFYWLTNSASSDWVPLQFSKGIETSKFYKMKSYFHRSLRIKKKIPKETSKSVDIFSVLEDLVNPVCKSFTGQFPSGSFYHTPLIP